MVLLWGLFAWPRGESTNDADIGDPGTESAADGDDDPGGADETGGEDTSEAALVAHEDHAAGLEDSDSEDPDSEDPGVEDDADTPADPLVGEPTGYGLAFGSLDSFAATTVLSLDTGAEIRIDRGGRPIGSFATMLVTASTSGAIRAFDLAEPDPVGRDVYTESSSEWIESVQMDGELIRTVVVRDTGIPEFLTVNLDGEVVESEDLSNRNFWANQTFDQELIAGSGGGVYVRTGDRYERVSIGNLIAVGQSLVLINECDAAMSCRLHWYRKGEWEPVDFPQPALPQFGQTFIDGDDRWLVSVDYGNSEAEVTISEIVTGRVERTSRSLGFGASGSPATISPDGRWLFERRYGSQPATIVDLETGAEWPLEIEGGGLGMAVEFVELAGTALEASGGS